MRHKRKAKVGGDNCYLLQVCSDKVTQEGEQGETAPDNGQEGKFWFDVNLPEIHIPTNPKPKQTPGRPAEPMIASLPMVQTANAPFVVTPEMVVDPLVRGAEWVQRAVTSTQPFEKSWAKPAATTYRVASPSGGVTLPRSAPTMTTPQKGLAVNKIGAKANLAYVGVDIISELLEAYNDGRIQTAADVVNILARYPVEVEQGLRYMGEKGYDAIMRGDLVTLGDVVASLNPSFATHKLAEETLQLLGVPYPGSNPSTAAHPKPPPVVVGFGDGPEGSVSATLDNIRRDLPPDVVQGAKDIWEATKVFNPMAGLIELGTKLLSGSG